jgi:hypothetical protein
MKPLDDAKLKHALIAAYHGKNTAEPGNYWEIKVMNHVRGLGPLQFDMTDFVWRFAAGACFLVLILSAYVMQTGFHPEYEMTELLLDDSAGLAFLSYFANIII